VILYTCGRSAAVSSPFVNLMRLYRSRGIGIRIQQRCGWTQGVRRERLVQNSLCAVPWPMGRNTRLFALARHSCKPTPVISTCAVSSRQRQRKRLTAIFYGGSKSVSAFGVMGEFERTSATRLKRPMLPIVAASCRYLMRHSMSTWWSCVSSSWRAAFEALSIWREVISGEHW